MAARLFQSLLGWVFDRLYNQLAWSYDLVSWLVSGGLWRQWHSLVLPYLVGPRVLEVSGPGRATCWYRSWPLATTPMVWS